MAEKTKASFKEMYKLIVESYLMTNSEHSLYEAQQFSRELIQKNMSPEEMVSMHISVIEELIPNLPKEVADSHSFLLEVMIDYGLAYQEHQKLRDVQKKLDSELEVAAEMQQALLPKQIPTSHSLDIGIKSVAANKVSGDYYHFIHDQDAFIGVAVADIIGKGVPAALCMSMIKYAMDSIPEQKLQPSSLLENLNKVVEQNISENMFITMVYGSYDVKRHKFVYAGAGHEPGFYYNFKEDRFEDLTTKGLVLGLTKKAMYKEFERPVSKGDLIILLSDGVTECRTKDGFLERHEIERLIRQYIDLPSQEIVNNVYNDLEQIQDFNLKDDFTLMIIRRDV